MLDRTDLRILEELTHNSRITMKELGEKVHLTGQAAAARLAKLEDRGVIEGYTIKVNQAKIGYPVHALLSIYTMNTHHQPYLTFIRSQDEYVMRNYKVSGDGCYILEARFPSHEQLDRFLVELNRYANYKLSIVINK